MTEPISNYQPPIEPQVAPPEQLPQSPQVTPKKSSVLPIIISVIILILIGAVGYLGFQVYQLNKIVVIDNTPVPTPDLSSETSAKDDHTADWKTFTNEEIGISFKYPQSWTTSKEDRGYSRISQAITILDTGIKETVSGEGTNHVLLVNYVPSKKKWIEVLQQDSHWDLMKDTQQDIKFGNNSFTKIKAPGMFTTVSYDANIGNDSFISFTMEPGNITDQELKNVYDTVLSTFHSNGIGAKGQSPGVIIGEENWVDLVIPEEKLKLKYPPEWEKSIRQNDNVTLLTAPSGFTLQFKSGLDGLGGGCDEECQSHNIPNVVLKTLDFYSTPLFVVVNGYKDTSPYGNANIRFNVIPKSACWTNVCYGFEGKNSAGTTIITGGLDRYMPVSEFTKLEDVKTALHILETISY